jgi:hypothetical protein
MVSRDIGYDLQQLSKRVNSLEGRVEELNSSTLESDWDNPTLMKNWKICKRTAANYRKSGLQFYKRGGRIFYTPEQRENFKNK